MSSRTAPRKDLPQRTSPALREPRMAAGGQGLRLTRMSFALAAAFSSLALGNPLNPTVVAGSATFQNTANALTVTNTNGTVINWKSFSIGSGEITRFIQSNAASQVLNRVTGGNPSLILGALQSNGRVFLINQNGVAFGPGAQVDVGGLVVSSLGLSNADFAAGRLNFTQQEGAGSIINQGLIRTASGGLVALVAPNIENHGVIQAPNGDVILAAGKSANLVDLQRPQIQVEVNADDNKALNVGQLVGRNIGIYAGAIRHSGVASATTASLDAQGRVVFKAAGDTLVSGTVSAGNSAGAGGRVEILGNRVGLLDGARVDASGATGGGTVLVGGDFHGDNPEVLNAQRTTVMDDVRITADALVSGDGGKVVVWADDQTVYRGSVSARGGASSGDGGFVEISGKQTLVYRGSVDTRAPQGATGTLLLDPASIVIQGGAGDGSDPGTEVDNINTGNPDGTVLFADAPLTYTVTQEEIEGTANNIVLEAADGITVTGTFTGNLVTVQSGNSLTLRTRNDLSDGTPAGIDLTGSSAGAALEFRTQGTGSILIETGTSSTPQAAPISTGKLTAAGSGSITLIGTGPVTVSGALATGDIAADGTTGAISVTSSLSSVVLNSNLTTGSATASDLGSAQSPVSGNISVSAATGISGSGILKTGNVSLNGTGGGADTLTSGSISLIAGTGGVSGGIGLSNANALQIGSATLTGGATADTITTGSISLTSRDAINNGTPLTALGLTISVASGAASTNATGTLSATTTGAAGNIHVTSAGPLRVGVLDTVDANTAAVAVTVTGGNLLEIANASNLDQDNLTLTADKIKVGAGVTAASAVVKPTAAQTIDLGSGLDTGFALDSAELGNFTVTHLEVGSATAGAITISTDVTPSNTGNLHLRTNGGRPSDYFRRKTIISGFSRMGRVEGTIAGVSQVRRLTGGILTTQKSDQLVFSTSWPLFFFLENKIDPLKSRKNAFLLMGNAPVRVFTL